MKYAVIKTGGKQYKVSEGDIVEVDKLPLEKNHEVEFWEILLYVSDGDAQIGRPILQGVKMKGKVLDQIKGEKIRVAKFKAKVRYRRVMGFRPLLTRVQIEKIEESKKDESLKVTPKKAAKKN